MTADMTMAKPTLKVSIGFVGDKADTVCRELKRNRGKNGYFPKQAQIKADKRQAASCIIITTAP